MDLQTVVPWGRSFDEYRDMFALSDADLQKTILGCADGPASFNAVLTKQGGKIISCDPIYKFSVAEIKERINETYETVIGQTKTNAHQYIWQKISSPEELGKIRMEAMQIFLKNFSAGKQAGRYLNETLPNLPFADKSFDLALCSHFLFLYSKQLSEEFHYQAITELCRVADEIRIFPLIDLEGQISVHLDPVCNLLKKDGLSIQVKQVPYEFQKGANQMLRITKNS